MKLNKKFILKYLKYTALAAVCIAIVGGAFWYFMRGYSFANPGYLWFFPPLVLLCIAAVFIKIYLQPSVKYPLPAGYRQGAGFGARLVKWLPFSLCVLALVCCVFALARPRIEGRTILPPDSGIDIILTIDVSGSMAAQDFTPSRIAAAKSTALDFISKRSTDRIGVVVFDNIAMLQAPLTLDYEALRGYIKNIDIAMVGSGGTAVGDALALSVKHLRDSDAKSKVIVLLTDGESNSDTVDPISAARAAHAYGIRVYTIAISAHGNIKMPVNTAYGTQATVDLAPLGEAAEVLLRQVAKITGGEFYRAANNLELQDIYAKIDALERTEYKEGIRINYKDAYQNLLWAALIMLLAAFALDKFIFIKLP